MSNYQHIIYKIKFQLIAANFMWHLIMLLLSTGRSEFQQYSHIIACAWNSGYSAGILELSHICILCLWWSSLLFAGSCLIVIYLFVCSRWLIITRYYYFHYLYNNQQWLCTKVRRRSRQLAIRLVCWQRWVTVSNIIIYMCISCTWGYTYHSVHRSTYH